MNKKTVKKSTEATLALGAVTFWRNAAQRQGEKLSQIKLSSKGGCQFDFSVPKNQSFSPNNSFKLLVVPYQNTIMPWHVILMVKLSIFPGFSKVRFLAEQRGHEISLPKTKPQTMKYNL